MTPGLTELEADALRWAIRSCLEREAEESREVEYLNSPAIITAKIVHLEHLYDACDTLRFGMEGREVRTLLTQLRLDLAKTAVEYAGVA